MRGPRLLVATGNPGKVRELAAILGDLPVTLVGLRDVRPGQAPEVVEDGETFLDNARRKAHAYAAWSGLPALADDSGLAVDALDGRPGVYSARYAGPGATDAGNVTRLLGELDGVPAVRRTAAFRCAAVLVVPAVGSDRPVGEWHAEGAWSGRITEAPRGEGGFGYDPVFLPDGWDLTAAEAGSVVKNEVSHRRRALAALRPAIEAWLDAWVPPASAGSGVT